MTFFKRHRPLRPVRLRFAEQLEPRRLLAGDVSVQISEVMATNASGLTTKTRTDANASFARRDNLNPDWIELRNPTDKPLDVAGFHLTDSRSVPTKWQLPAGTTIPASGYLVVFASGLDIRDTALDQLGYLHTNFQLGSDGEYLAITAGDGSVINAFEPNYPAQFVDISYGISDDGEPGYLRVATPGQSNGETYDGIVADTRFSVDRGFYDTPLEVEITTATDGAQVRFTTDGSEPTSTSGQVYVDPIVVSTTTNLRAAAFKEGFIPTNVDTHTYIFAEDVIRQPAEIPGFPTGGRVWAGQNTYVPQDSEMDPDIVDDPRYRGVIVDGLKSIPTMSITSNVDEIFSNSGWYDGEDVEKEVSVEVLYADAPKQNHQSNAGIESHSHDRLKRSLRLNFRGLYGDSTFETDLFQTAPTHGDTAVEQVKRVILRGGNNRSWARIWNPDKTAYTIDEFARSTQIAMSGYGMRGNFVHLYINGVYWGLYNPVERSDEFFTASYFGGDPADWFAVNHGGDLDGDDDRYDYLVRSLIRRDLSDASNYDEFREYLDVEGFVDYLIIAWWTAVSDWPQNNWYGGNRNETSPLGASPFRYFTWDSEWSWGEGGQSSSNGKAHVHADFRNDERGDDPLSQLWHAARANPEFMTMFADRVHKHLFNDGSLTEANAKARWMTLNDYIRDAVVAESARWGDAMESAGDPTRTRDGDWQRQVDRILGLMTGNNNTFIRALRREGYYPKLDAPEMNQHGGEVPPGFELSLSNPNATGIVYFTQDGSDPRMPGGEVSLTARQLDNDNTVVLTRSASVKSRVWDGSEWSALADASFVVDKDSSIRMTEIMFNPAAPTESEVAAGFVDNDDFEFLEVQNTGQGTVDLNGHEFTAGIDFHFPPMQLAPGEFAVVAKNTNAFRIRYGDDITVAGQFTRGSLSNSGERITLNGPLGSSVQSIDYSDQAPWPVRADGVGASLELIDPQETPHEQLGKHYRWRGSSQFGGSPGNAGDDALKIVINEVLTNTRGIYIEGDANGDGAVTFGDFLILSSNFGNQTSNPSDGNFDNDGTVGFSDFLVLSANFGRKRTDSIELFNASDQAIDMGGWYLSDSATELFKFQIPAETVLGAGDYVTFDESHFNRPGDSAGFALSGSGGDDVWLVTSDGKGNLETFVDDIHFPAAADGEPFGRVAGADGAIAPLLTYTLNQPNALPRVGPVIFSEIQYSPKPPSAAALAVHPSLISQDLEFIEIHNPTGSPVDMTRWQIRGGVDFDFPAGTILAANETVVVLPFDPAQEDNARRLGGFLTHYAAVPGTRVLGGFTGRLDNSGERLWLSRPGVAPDDPSELIGWLLEDEVIYDNLAPWPSAAGGTGESLQRVAPLAYGNDPASWSSRSASLGTYSIPAGRTMSTGNGAAWKSSF